MSFFLLELGTGMRRGEILALKWSDLNFATGELRIERQVYIIKAEGDYIGAENKSLDTHCYSATVTLENPCGV